ncbi:hypothetical protein [Pseudonocardia sp. HH130630-07]|uniref:hypothetical protein n=1 Tax=Pseudonocardia sp. HH130630-07 TaxID=1690815 RepID=UPI00081534DD|nr:hypothetical protein [Pseudonocardia sp. HH130630-07]ANY06250.1 hypothetical protein AFB00_07995 [Pseudonocardia sp. HH130630-07]
MTENYAGAGPVDDAPGPGIVPFRALRAGEIVIGAMRFVLANPVPVLLASLVLALPTAVVRGIGVASASVDPFVVVMFDGLVPALLMLALAPPATAMVLATLRTAVLDRRPVVLGEAWEAARPRLGALYGLTLAVTGVVVVFMLLAGGAVLLSVSPSSAAAGAVLTVLVLAAYPVMLWMTVRFVLAPVALVLETLPVGAALRRSVHLVRGSWWRCLGTLLLAGLPAALVLLVASFVATLLSQVYGPPAFVAIGIPILAIAQAAIFGFGVGVIGLLHRDQHIRQEERAAAFGAVAGLER